MKIAGVLIMTLIVPACAGTRPQPRQPAPVLVRILTPEEEIRSQCPTKALARRYGNIASVLEHHPDEYTAYEGAIRTLNYSKEELSPLPEFRALADDCGKVLEELASIKRVFPAEPAPSEVRSLVRHLRSTERAADRMSACTE